MASLIPLLHVAQLTFSSLSYTSSGPLASYGLKFADHFILLTNGYFNSCLLHAHTYTRLERRFSISVFVSETVGLGTLHLYGQLQRKYCQACGRISYSRTEGPLDCSLISTYRITVNFLLLD